MRSKAIELVEQRNVSPAVRGQLPEFRGLRVPDVLLSGDHGKIAEWRREQAVARTRERRPDLLTRQKA